MTWNGQESKVLLHCFGGCHPADVVASLGLRLADLFEFRQTTKRLRRAVVATYPYVNQDGVVLAEKVRYLPKNFKWRRPDSDAPSGYRWDLEGLTGKLPLYRQLDIRGPSVVVVEGEKAVERLHELGIVATCPPSSSAGWPDRLTQDLRGFGVAMVVILPDADTPGGLFALRVAASVVRTEHNEVPMTAKILRLPGLSAGADVVDWLDAGGCGETLQHLVAATPLWFPDQVERERAARRRMQNAERQKRFRAKAKQVRLAAAS